MSTFQEFDEKQQASLLIDSNKPIQTKMKISTGDEEGKVMQMMASSGKGSHESQLMQMMSNSSSKVQTTGQGKKMPKEVQAKMENSFGANFSGVNIHANSQKSTNMGALAYAQGNNIHFAPGQYNPMSYKGQELLGHELAHVVQQSQGRVKATTQAKGLPVNDDVNLEKEADLMGKKAALGETITERQSFISGKGQGSNIIQRHIKDKGKVNYGEFEIDMDKQEIPADGTKAGEKGTIKFTPNGKSPNTSDIKLIQIVKTLDMSKTPDEDYTWTGGESDRNSVQTSQDITIYKTKENDTLTSISEHQAKGHVSPSEIYQLNSTTLGVFDPNKKIHKDTQIKIPSVQEGYFIDHFAGSTKAAPRTSSTDADVPLAYREYAPNSSSSQDGHKNSSTDIDEASLWDFPGGGSSFDIKFDFETVARSMDKGFDYGTLHWGFRINSGLVSDEYSQVESGKSGTFESAIKEFNEFYNNHHIVVEGETLYEIAELYYGDGSKWPEIQKANGLKNTIIHKAQKLIIPSVTVI